MPSSKQFGTWRQQYTQYPPGTIPTDRKAVFGVGDLEGGLIWPNIGPEIRMLTRDVAPFVYLVSNLRKEVVYDQQFRWVDDDYANPFVQYTGPNETSPATSITVAAGHGARLRVNDILFNVRTGERMRVTGISGDTLTVVRNWGSIPGTPLLNTNDILTQVGYAAPAADQAPPALRTTKRIMSNYTQIFWRTWAQSGSSLSIKLITGEIGEWAYQEAKMLKELQMEVERAFIFGIAREDTAADVRTTSGVLDLLGWKGGTTADCPVLDHSGGFNLASFVAWSKEVSFYDSSPRVLLASPEYIQLLYNGLASLTSTPYRWNAQAGDDRFKLGWTELDLGFTSFRVLKSYTLRADQTSAGGGAASRRVRAIAIPTDSLAYCYLEGRDGIRYETPLPNQLQKDYRQVSVEMECGLKLWHPEKFGIILA